ncbi:flavohemoglobin expression-modulating QEGLA motif protein [Dyella sp. ASV21]|uniref:flavohemoglobin expression-modulating QEGLA motif protein n=1 Tax=Dyella sp. ASV21 TaxID=2795114 RepID=UPI0018EBBF5E|nr:flavohemoglobin expression-modulating QEGLA motif protein [Dyella sp. ASV21]
MSTVASAPELDRALAPLLECDSALVKVARKIKVLKAIDWPVELEATFLAGYERGNPQLPEPPRRHPDLSGEMDALKAIMARLDRGHPIGDWLFKTAWSYLTAAQMLMNVGTETFTRCSTALYGRPDAVHPSQVYSAVDAAQDVINITDDLVSRDAIPPVPADIPAEVFAERLRERLGNFFNQDRVEVVLDPSLPSKATAGSRSINLRATAMFSELDLEQLTEHEAFVHTATLLNGKHQPYLKSLGLGAPRTTRTQEGLATFSEIITGAIDLARLRRVALRVLMVKRALDGADFIEVFRGFLDAGQSAVESYRSASRIFRGGDVRGRICFTKDSAYLEGVMIVYVFIRKVLQAGQVEMLPLLFAGRVTTTDVITLSPYLQSGLIQRAVYVPPWARNPQRVLSLMAFFTAAQRFRLDTLNLDNFVAYENELVDETLQTSWQ